jgi:hypothetical protein
LNHSTSELNSAESIRPSKEETLGVEEEAVEEMEDEEEEKKEEARRPDGADEAGNYRA